MDGGQRQTGTLAVIAGTGQQRLQKRLEHRQLLGDMLVRLRLSARFGAKGRTSDTVSGSSSGTANKSSFLRFALRLLAGVGCPRTIRFDFECYRQLALKMLLVAHLLQFLEDIEFDRGQPKRLLEPDQQSLLQLRPRSR